MNHIICITGIVAFGLATLTAAPAIAQTQGSQAGQLPFATRPAQNFSQEQLQNFADASAEVSSIQQAAKQKLQQTESKKARLQIFNQAQRKMWDAIRDSGLTLQEYNRINRAAQSNPQLAQQIQQMQ